MTMMNYEKMESFLVMFTSIFTSITRHAAFFTRRHYTIIDHLLNAGDAPFVTDSDSIITARTAPALPVSKHGGKYVEDDICGCSRIECRGDFKFGPVIPTPVDYLPSR